MSMEIENTGHNNRVKTKPKEQKRKVCVKGTMAGLTAAQVAPLATMPISVAALSSMCKYQKNLTADQVELLNKAGEQILKTTNLGEKGVTIKHLDNIVNTTGLPDKVLELINPVFGAAKGKNAFFTDKAMEGICGKNSVVLNKVKMAATQFHELGHAFNFNNSAFWKTMQKMRMPGMIAGAAIAIFAACTRNSEPKEGEALTKGQKAKNFVRKNSGILAFASMVPMLAEEGMASIRGCKWASKLLPKNLAKHVAKTNVVAYTTYLATAAGVGLAAFAATKIKDHFVEKQKAKNT